MEFDEDEFDTQEFLKNFGKRIAKVRKSKGYSQDRLSLEAGLARGTLSKIEAGLRDARASTLFRLADVLGISPGEFFRIRKF